MSSTPTETPVLIVGGGPSGLVLALALAQNGVQVRIIEKNTSFHAAQRGSGIQPRSLELFKFLGVLPDIWAGSRWNNPSAIYKMPEGKEIAKIVDMTPYVEPTPDVPFRSPRIIGQSHTEEILRGHLAKYNVFLEMGTELISFAQDDDGVTAEVLAKEGNTEEKKSIRAQYLVSAEGAKSVVRKQLGIPFTGETKDTMRLVLADIHVTGVSTEYWHQWGDMGSKTVRIRPTEYPGIFSLMAGGKDADTAALAASRDELLKFVYDVTKRGPEELQFGEMRSLSEFRPNIRLADRYSDGRVFLVGDAAHVHSPTGGQGLNTGIQDSFNLAWKLSLVVKNRASPSLLYSYTAERRPVAKDVLSMTSEIMNKTVAFKTGGEPVFAQRPKALHQLGVNYRFSDLVADEQPTSKNEQSVSAAYRPEDPTVLRAGDRAPDAPGLLPLQLTRDGPGEEYVEPGAGTTTIFDIFKPTKHTVLVFVGIMNITDIIETLKTLTTVPKDALQVVCIVPQEYQTSIDLVTLGSALADATTQTQVFIDTKNHAHIFYSPTTHGFPVIIIRPDAYIGAIVQNHNGALRYLQSIFPLSCRHTKKTASACTDTATNN